MLLACFLLLAMEESVLGKNRGLEVARSFENPLDVSDDYLAFPNDAEIAPDGRLYIADRNQSRILIWHADGRFQKGFGKQGEGPGEMLMPNSISIFGKEIWVWDTRMRVSIFDLDGQFIESQPTTGLFPRRMLVLSKNKAILGVRAFNDQGAASMKFALLDRSQGTHANLLEWDNESFVTNISGEDGNTVTIDAYAHEIDAQRDPEGNLWFGFSQENVLRRISAEGVVEGEWRFHVPPVKPTEADKEMIKRMTFPMPNGQRVSLDSFPGITLLYDKPKSPYTHFTFKEDKVLMVQTPIGSLGGVGNGWSEASYYILDRKTGKPLSRGNYSFPEDSTIFYRNGRIIACIVAGDEDYSVKELRIKGF